MIDVSLGRKCRNDVVVPHISIEGISRDELKTAGWG